MNSCVLRKHLETYLQHANLHENGDKAPKRAHWRDKFVLCQAHREQASQQSKLYKQIQLLSSRTTTFFCSRTDFKNSAHENRIMTAKKGSKVQTSRSKIVILFFFGPERFYIKNARATVNVYRKRRTWRQGIRKARNYCPRENRKSEHEILADIGVVSTEEIKKLPISQL